MPKTKMIKADAQVSVTFGTPFISRLQQAMMYIAQDLSDEQLIELRDQIINGVQNFDEPVLQHTATLLFLISDIEKKIVDSNLYNEEEVEGFTPPEN